MLRFIQTVSLSAILASGTIFGGQSAMAGGCGQSCASQATCAAPAVPTGNVAPPLMQMDHAGHAQVNSRTRYQSTYRAPAAQPQYYAPAPQYRAPARNNGLRSDFQYQLRAGRKIEGL